MKLIIGLGNPGKEYENTRHNIGFMVLDYFLGNKKMSEKFNALYELDNNFQDKVLFIKPLTYMNASGDALIQFVNYYKINHKDILVIQDDLDLPVGKYRLKYNSSSGGHNGIKSIISVLGTEEIPRLKVGIAHNKNVETKDYVLGKFGKQEISMIQDNMPIFKDIIVNFINYGIDDTMQKYNKK